MSHPHVELRGRVHWYRRRIPRDLVTAYGGRRELRRSLKTSDRKEAIRLARLQSVQHDAEFERKRKERAALQAPSPVFEDVELTEKQIRRLCLLWHPKWPRRVTGVPCGRLGLDRDHPLWRPAKGAT